MTISHLGATGWLHHVARAPEHCATLGLHEFRRHQEVELPASPDEVWEQVADSDRLGEWLEADVELDARPAARAASRFADGEVRRALVRDVEPGRRLAFTWWPLTGVDVGRSTSVTITIEPTGAGSRLRLVETRARRGRLPAQSHERARSAPRCGVLCPRRPGAAPPARPARRAAVRRHRARGCRAGEPAGDRQAPPVAGRGGAGVAVSRRARGALRPHPRPLEDAAGWMETVGAEWDQRLARLRGNSQPANNPIEGW